MTKLFNVRLFHVDVKTGEKTGGYQHGHKMNAEPMTHSEAVTFKAKLSNLPGRVFELEETAAG